MDGVIVDNASLKMSVARDLGFTLRLKDTPSEVIKEVLPSHTLRKLQKIIYEDPEVSLMPPLMKGIKTILSGIKKKKLSYYLISRRKVPDVAISLLKKHGLWPSYFNEKNSFFVSEPEDKDKIAAQLGITHYIDDQVKVINALSSVKNKFLFDSLDIFKDADHYIKVKSWADMSKRF